MTKVKITKIESITESSKNSKIYDDYWVEGWLMDSIKVGGYITLMRDRNIKQPLDIKYGFFNTSEIVNIDKDIVQTKNSKYKVEIINE